MPLPESLRARMALPVVCAPMFLASSPELAAACMTSGIAGSLTMNHCRDLAEWEQQLAHVSEAVARHEGAGGRAGPLFVNIATTLPETDFRAHLDLATRHGAQVVVTSVGNPSAVRPMIADAGLLHFHDVTAIRFAEKAAAAGVDGMVAIGAGGGGHAGTISHLALIPAIRGLFSGTIAMAGAISTGAGVRAAQVLGADLAYMGTRFIATREASVPDSYKAMLVTGGVEDVIYTRGVNGLPASWLKESLRGIGLDPENLFIPSGRSTDHLPPGKTPWRDIWSGGQGLGLIDDIPATADLVARLAREYADACAVPAWSQP